MFQKNDTSASVQVWCLLFALVFFGLALLAPNVVNTGMQ